MAAESRLHPGRALLLVGLVIGGVLFWDSAVLLPFKLLAVMGHETGHARAAWLVGGSVDRVSLALNRGGECISRIPDGQLSKGRGLVRGKGARAAWMTHLGSAPFRHHPVGRATLRSSAGEIRRAPALSATAAAAAFPTQGCDTRLHLVID